nr:octapeptide-repeat protein T2-like [Nomia melanderi]
MTREHLHSDKNIRKKQEHKIRQKSHPTLKRLRDASEDPLEGPGAAQTIPLEPQRVKEGHERRRDGRGFGKTEKERCRVRGGERRKEKCRAGGTKKEKSRAGASETKKVAERVKLKRRNLEKQVRRIEGETKKKKSRSRESETKKDEGRVKRRKRNLDPEQVRRRKEDTEKLKQRNRDPESEEVR